MPNQTERLEEIKDSLARCEQRWDTISWQDDMAWLIEQVEAARRETWLEAAKVADARAKFLESVRTQSEGWFAISELKGIAAALRAKAEEGQ